MCAAYLRGLTACVAIDTESQLNHAAYFVQLMLQPFQRHNCRSCGSWLHSTAVLLFLLPMFNGKPLPAATGNTCVTFVSVLESTCRSGWTLSITPSVRVLGAGLRTSGCEWVESTSCTALHEIFHVFGVLLMTRVLNYSQISPSHMAHLQRAGGLVDNRWRGWQLSLVLFCSCGIFVAVLVLRDAID